VIWKRLLLEHNFFEKSEKKLKFSLAKGEFYSII